MEYSQHYRGNKKTVDEEPPLKKDYKCEDEEFSKESFSWVDQNN